MTFRAALEASGLRPRDVVADGRIRRCRTENKPQHRNGWYVLHPDGRGYWGDWASGSGEALGSWKDETASSKPPSEAVMARLRYQRERDRQHRINAMTEARRLWAASSELRGHHPYLEAKGLAPTPNLRVWQGTIAPRDRDPITDRWLVVPMMLGDRIINVQRISSSGVKLFYPAAPVDGSAYTLRRVNAAVTAFAEGFSTALAVFQAVRMASVVCCFNAGNLTKVVNRVKPSGSVVFAADNDHGTLARRGFNPGLEAANKSAELIGAGVAWPEGIEGTDWADAAAEWGEGAGRKIERLILSKAKFVLPTG